MFRLTRDTRTAAINQKKSVRMSRLKRVCPSGLLVRVLRCQYAPAKVLLVWLNSVWNPFPPKRCDGHFWGVGWSNKFCTLPKQTIRHSHPLHAVTDRLCGGEKGARVWTSLSSCYTTISVTFGVYQSDRFWHLAIKCVQAHILGKFLIKWNVV